VDIDNKTCPCCQGELHRIGEDRSERLDMVPAQFRVLVTRRPKCVCRICEDGVVQAPAPGLSEILCLRRVDHHEFTKRSLNMMAN
jgi:transposase